MAIMGIDLGTTNSLACVCQDGSGFSVTFYGNVTDFGGEPSVEFYDLRDCY